MLPPVDIVDEFVMAAVSIGRILDSMGIQYAVAGGVACRMWGSGRQTRDIDVVVDVHPDQVRALKKVVRETLDPQFCIPIEMLPVSLLVFPQPLQSGSIGVNVSGHVVRVLSPSAIILGKCGRIVANMDSTRPASMSKLQSDLADVLFLIPRISRSQFRDALTLYPMDKSSRLKAHIAQWRALILLSQC